MFVFAERLLITEITGILVDSLGLSDGLPYSEFLLYLLYTWLSGSVLGPIESLLWMPVELKADASIKTAAYDKIMTLSCDFHTDKQSGEMYKSIEQGSSITGLLDTAAFFLFPIIADLFVAYLYLYSHPAPVVMSSLNV